MPVTPRIVGLAGYARSGKATFGSTLIAYGCRRLSFADPIRAAIRAIDPIVAYVGDGEPIDSNREIELATVPSLTTT